MTDDEYEKMTDALILDFVDHPEKFQMAEDFVHLLEPDHPMNIKISAAAKKVLKISSSKFRVAMDRSKKALEKKIASMDMEQRIIATIGGIPRDEREFVDLMLNHKGYSMAFDGEFHFAGASVSLASVKNDLVLTASSLNFTSPRGQLLSNANIHAALSEWMAKVKQERRLDLFATIMDLSDERNRETIFSAFRTVVCDRYFTEPEFAMAAISKFIWQVKRKMTDREIKAHHMVIVQSEEQFTGKTTFCRFLMEAVKPLSAETDASQIVDDRNSSLRERYVIFLDELSNAERADITKLKAIITGVDNTSRVLYSHDNQTVKLNMTFLGTSNPPLGKIVFDTTGMRRFIEVRPRPLAEIEPYWDGIAAFDWLGLWQAVDAAADDPIMSVPAFRDRLMEQQEEMRAKDNVEAWLLYFDLDQTSAMNRTDYTKGSHASFFATDLYQMFRKYEEQYHPASHGTSLTRWGTDMKSMIGRGKAKGWSVNDTKRKTIYTYQTSNVTPMRSSQKAMADGLL